MGERHTTFQGFWDNLGFSSLCDGCDQDAAYQAWMYQQEHINKLVRNIDIMSDIQQDKSAHIAKLEANIALALRLQCHNVPGFIGDALRGRDLSNIPMLKDASLMEFLDACDAEDERNAAGQD